MTAVLPAPNSRQPNSSSGRSSITPASTHRAAPSAPVTRAAARPERRPALRERLETGSAASAEPATSSDRGSPAAASLPATSRASSAPAAPPAACPSPPRTCAPTSTRRSRERTVTPQLSPSPLVAALMHLLRRTLVGAVVAIAAAALPSTASAAVTLQPGAYHETDAGSCTLNFAYSGNGKTYLGTAAHCVESLGQRVRDIEGTEFG